MKKITNSTLLVACMMALVAGFLYISTPSAHAAMNANGTMYSTYQNFFLPPGIQRKLNRTGMLPPGIAMHVYLTGSTTPIVTPPPTPTTTPTTTPLAISNVTAFSTSSTSESIVWLTNKPATSFVWYGTTTPLFYESAFTASSSVLTYFHMLNLTGLTASTTYNYLVISSTTSETATSTPFSFVTRNW